MFHRPYLLLLFLILLLPLPVFSEAVYDSRGNLIRSSQWLKPSKKQQTDSQNIQQVVEEQKQAEEPLVQEQQAMSETSFISDRFFSSKEMEDSKASSLPDFLLSKGFLIMASGGSGTKTELSYKGFTAFCIKVYIDGILSNNPATGEFDWNSIDLASIDSIVISEMPMTGTNEFAGCAIFITSKTGKTNSLFARASVSSYESNFMDGIFQSVNYTRAKDDFYYRIGFSSVFCDNEYIKEKLSTRNDINKFNFSKMLNANFVWNKKAGKNWSLSGANTFAYNMVKVFNTQNSLATGLEEDLTTQNNITLSFENQKLKSQTIFTYFYGQVEYLNQWTQLQSDIDYTRIQNLSLRENFSYKADYSLGFRQEHSFTSSADRFQFDAGFSRQHNIADFTFTPCLQTIIYNDSSWHFEALPRLSVTYNNILGLSFYRSFTMPTFNQLYWPSQSNSQGNPDLKPEDGWACSLSLKKTDFPLWFRFTYSYYQNKIRWATKDGKLMPVNLGNADYYVAVLGLDKSFWNERLVLSGDVTMTQARLRETGKQIMWVPQFQAHSTINFTYGNFTALADYAFTSERYTSNDNTSSYSPFHLVDLTLSWQLNEELQVFAQGTNLLDQHAPYHDGYYIPSRKWTLGVEMRR